MIWIRVQHYFQIWRRDLEISWHFKIIAPRFSFQLTHTSWPSGQLKAFYKDYISNRSYAKHYNSLREPHRNTTTNLEIRSLIGRNFAGVQMYIDQTTMMEFNDRPQLPFIGFISQLGGALNLWAGITVVIVIELIEIIYELLAKKYSGKEETKGSDSNNSGSDEEKMEVLVETKESQNGNEWVWENGVFCIFRFNIKSEVVMLCYVLSMLKKWWLC